MKLEQKTIGNLYLYSSIFLGGGTAAYSFGSSLGAYFDGNDISFQIEIIKQSVHVVPQIDVKRAEDLVDSYRVYLGKKSSEAVCFDINAKNSNKDLDDSCNKLTENEAKETEWQKIAQEKGLLKEAKKLSFRTGAWFLIMLASFGLTLKGINTSFEIEESLEETNRKN